MDESLRFYQDVIGLKVNRKLSPAPGMEIVFLGAESVTEVELIKNDKNNNPMHGKDVFIGFEVETLEVAMKILEEKGIKIHSGPFQPNPMTKFLYIQDPNGVMVQLVEKINK
jgi:lactoylglutathione lyase